MIDDSLEGTSRYKQYTINARQRAQSTNHDVSSLHSHGKGTIRPHTTGKRSGGSECVGGGNDSGKYGGDLHG